MRNVVFIGKFPPELGRKSWASGGKKVTNCDFFTSH